MRFNVNNCDSCRRKLAEAEAYFWDASEQMKKEKISDEEKFAILWGLAFSKLQSLEDCRSPS